NSTGIFHFPQTWPDSAQNIFLQIRLPRIIGAMLVGAALSTAGVLFQGLLRNPLADPYLIGTAAGAGLGAAAAMALPLSLTFYVLGFGIVGIFAFVGALVTVLVVHSIARVGSKTPVTTLLLSGFAVSSVLTAVMSFLMAMSTRMQQIMYWLMGGISVKSWEQLLVVAVLMVVGIALAYVLSPHLNAFALGEDMASHLGIAVEREKVAILAVASLLTAAAVTIAGLVGFVGLVIPHVVRLILGPDHRLLLPVAAVGGGIFLILADTAARTVLAPTEVPVGILTAIVGGPFFIYLLRRNRKEYSF
ncbi:MAG: iron ABC transporter permease, partial [Chloroflexi bacterium]|nr:iron ABC transporter permease [Chloroflexota bacterium]